MFPLAKVIPNNNFQEPDIDQNHDQKGDLKVKSRLQKKRGKVNKQYIKWTIKPSTYGTLAVIRRLAMPRVMRFQIPYWPTK